MSVPNRFDYIQYDDESAKLQAAFKARFMELEEKVQIAFSSTQNGRYRALALTSLEEAYCWIGKAIREDQIAQHGKVSLQEGRNNS